MADADNNSAKIWMVQKRTAWIPVCWELCDDLSTMLSKLKSYQDNDPSNEYRMVPIAEVLEVLELGE